MSKVRISPVTIKKLDEYGEWQVVNNPVPSPAEVRAASTRGRGYGWKREQLAMWGVPWPPPKGWRNALTAAYNAQQKMR